MTRRDFLVTVISVPLTANGVPAPHQGFHVTGTLTATDQEAQEGYFALGTELAIVTTPHSPIADDLRAMVNTAVQCSVFQP